MFLGLHPNRRGLSPPSMPANPGLMPSRLSDGVGVPAAKGLLTDLGGGGQKHPCSRAVNRPVAAHRAPPSLGFSKQEHWSHFLLQCMKVKNESEVTQSCLTLSDPMDYSPPGSSIHGIFQARVPEWGARDCYLLVFGLGQDTLSAPQFSHLCIGGSAHSGSNSVL